MTVAVDGVSVAGFDDDELALVNAFSGEKTARITDVVRQASLRRPSARVRSAYWELVTRGVLVPDAGGRVQLSRPA